jgi:hypothetical protein
MEAAARETGDDFTRHGSGVRLGVSAADRHFFLLPLSRSFRFTKFHG